MEESFNPRVQDTSDQEDDDTLSLSDLPIYGDGGETPGKDLVLKEYTSSLSFEFFSEDWSSTILKGDPTNHNDPTVVFCGKIIPHKETPACENITQVVENKKRRKLGYRSLACWNFNSLSKSSSYKSTGSTSGRSYGYKGDQKDEIPVGRVSIVTTAAPKSKWYLYIFGLARFPQKMHVRDLRRRQGSSRTSKRSDGGSIVGGDGGSSSKGVGWWALIRVLGCAGGGDDDANAVVKATYGLAP